MRTYHVQNLRGGLHDVRGVSAGVRDGIVNPCGILHMLTQEFHADVHQLHGVQRAAALLGIACRMRGDAGELVFHLDAGNAGTGSDLVIGERMPRKRGVELLPGVLARHKGFACAAFFAGAAEENDRAGFAGFFEIFLHGKGRGKGTCAQHIVSAAMSAAAGNQLFALRHAALLRKTGEGVKLAQNADDRLPAAESTGKGRRNLAQALFHCEAVLCQHLAVEFHGLIFEQRELCIFPDLIAYTDKDVLLFVNEMQRILLLHKNCLLCLIMCNRWKEKQRFAAFLSIFRSAPC